MHSFFQGENRENKVQQFAEEHKIHTYTTAPVFYWIPSFFPTFPLFRNEILAALCKSADSLCFALFPLLKFAVVTTR